MAHAIVVNHDRLHSRFTSLSDDSTYHLSPIKGYENMPSVSLEKAVKPISHLFHNINKYMRVAMTNCENPADGLTQQQAASIYLYTMEFKNGSSLYLSLNGVLRTKQHSNIKPWFLYLKLFLTALQQLPSYTQTVWRGVRGVNLSSQYKKGQMIVWWHVSSCTLSMNTLESDQFLGKHGVRTIFCIKCLNGKNITAHSYYKNQEEVILMPGSYFIVEGILNPAIDLHIIQIKEIQSPYPLDEPSIDYESISEIPTEVSVSKKPIGIGWDPASSLEEPTAIFPMRRPSILPKKQLRPVSYLKQYPQEKKHASKLYKPAHVTDSNKDWKCLQKWNKIKIAIITIFVLLTFLPIATLIFGVLNIGDCPIQIWVPVWMTIFGAFALLTFGVLILIGLITILCCSYDDRQSVFAIGGGFLCASLLIFLAWLIAGSVWVFPIYTTVQFNQTNSGDYCQEDLYKFAFGLLILQYALIIPFLLISYCIYKNKDSC